MIWDFVHESGGKIENQLRKLGFSLDWSREKFTLDPLLKVALKIRAPFDNFFYAYENDPHFHNQVVTIVLVAAGMSIVSIALGYGAASLTKYINYDVYKSVYK